MAESPSVCKVTLAQSHFQREKVGMKVVAVSYAVWLVDLVFKSGYEGNFVFSFKSGSLKVSPCCRHLENGPFNGSVL